jgi:hypothetical protein
MSDDTKKWQTPPPPATLDISLYRKARRIWEIDTTMWTYLLAHVPEGPGSYKDRKAMMLASISPELRRYFLIRQFDWERGSGGIEDCMMKAEDDMLIEDTIAAYDSIGARQHAQIIRELAPIARARRQAIEAADFSGHDFDYDSNNPFDRYDDLWDKAGERFDFVGAIFKDIKKHPEKYTHP